MGNQTDSFDDVIWSDETSAQLETHHRFCCRKEGMKPQPKHPVKVHVWAENEVTGVCIFEGKMDVILYYIILRKTFLPFIEAKFPPPTSHRFMQDNDSKHCSKYDQRFYEEVGINWWRTPPELPDLNLIENLRHEMKDYLRREID